MKRNNLKRYEAPKAEVIVIECQGVLCTSAGGGTGTGIGGKGFHFNTSDGNW